MSTPPYRGLRILLGVISVGTAIGGLLLIFGGKALVLRIFLSPPEAEVPTLMLMALKETGGLLLMFSLLVFFTLRDPARNVAIIDALIFGLCLAFAGLLYYLRPRELSVQA